MFVLLLRELPIDDAAGACKGRIFPCLEYDRPKRNAKAWFRGDNGDKCAAFLRFECDLYETKEAAEKAKEK